MTIEAQHLDSALALSALTPVALQPLFLIHIVARVFWPPKGETIGTVLASQQTGNGFLSSGSPPCIRLHALLHQICDLGWTVLRNPASQRLQIKAEYDWC